MAMARMARAELAGGLRLNGWFRERGAVVLGGVGS